MKVKLQQRIFPDQHLRSALTGSKGEKEVSEKQFASNLIRSASGEESLIQKYLKCLEAVREMDHHKIATRLVSSLSKELKKAGKAFSSSDLLERVKWLSQLLATPNEEKSKRKAIEKEEISRMGKKGFQYGQFPQERFLISEFNTLAKDFDRLEVMKRRVDIHCEKDPEIKKKKKFLDSVSSSSKLAENRFMHKEGQIKNNQKMILVKGPNKKKVDEVKKYWEMVAKKETPLMVTLCSPFEWSAIIAFWNPDVLAKVSDQIAKETGVKIKYQGKKILYEGKNKIENEGKKKRVKIIERTYSLKDSDGVKRIATHLHYRHWPDRQPAPDLQAFDILVKRRQELLQNRNTPMVINCKGGVGRTGLFSLFECCRNEIDNQIEKGTPIHKIKLNLPEIIYELRRFAPNLIGKEIEQLAQVCELVHGYYIQLTSKQKATA